MQRLLQRRHWANSKSRNLYCFQSYSEPTSFPGSLILPPPGASEGSRKMRDPGNEVDSELFPGNVFSQNVVAKYFVVFL